MEKIESVELVVPAYLEIGCNGCGEALVISHSG